MTHPARLARIDEGLQQVDQSPFSFQGKRIDIDHKGLLGGSVGWRKRRHQTPPRIRRERTDKHQLGLAVMPVATIAFGEAARLPQQLPARRPVAGAVKARAVNEGFR